MSALPRPAVHARAMRVADLDAVLAIEAQCYGFPWTRGNFVDSLAAGYLARVWFASDGELLGYTVAMAGVGEMHLLNITVAPRWQRRGLARAMLDEIDIASRQAGCTELWLEVRTSNARARELYARRGFVEVGWRRAYYPAAQGQREDAVVMRYTIPPGATHALD